MANIHHIVFFALQFYQHLVYTNAENIWRREEMRIKTIYIQGFKSFMDKLNVKLSPGISAFVGPNGCGKSNIVDAIRWALGEQSPKKLRGRQMEDMIFSGASSSKPLGRAEVTLTFENGTGPHDSEEISVTRRLFRSGESEYLINNALCRLKDIHDLFMDTGLGNRAYSIIAQGEISTIIEQKPEETRLLLEEAAGISKYKVRRETSLRKIALTKDNLSRVEDLLVEIKKEMDTVKRQAGKARRFKEVSAEIRHSNLVLSAHGYEELQADKAKRRKVIEEITERAKGLENRFSESESAIETRNMELIQKQKAVSALKESVYSLREEGRKHEAALQRLSDDQGRFLETDAVLSREKDELAKKARGFQSEIKEINSRLTELRGSIQEVSSLRSDCETILREKAKELETKREVVEEERARHIELTTKEAGLEGEIRNLSDMISQSEIRRNELERESRQSAQRLEAVSSLLREKRETQEELSGRIGSFAKAIQEQETAQGSLEEARKKKQAARLQVDSELGLLRTQLKTIRGLIENYEGYRSGVRTIMNQYGSRTGNGGRVLGVLADFIKVEPEFEAAVEAVLDERLQYVVVAHQRDGEEAVAYLRSRNVGRSYFVPLEEFTLDRASGVERFSNNGFPLLRDHISVSDRFKRMVQFFLGNAALVESLSGAIAAWNNGSRKQTLVTPEGDLVDERGVIIGGRFGKENVGLLQRRREERELCAAIEEKEHLLISLQSELNDMRLEEQKVEGILLELQSERDTYGKQAEALEKGLFLLEGEAEQHTHHAQYVGDQLEVLKGEADGRRSRMKDLEAALLEYRREKEGVKRSVSESETALKELESTLNDLREELSNIILRYNGNKEEERGLTKEKERIEQFLGEIGERISKTEEEIESDRDRYQKSLVLEKELKGAMTAAHERQRELEAEVNGSEQDIEAVRQELRDKEKEVALLRERIGEARDEINDQRIGEAEVDFQIKGIISQVGRDTGLNLESEYQRYLEKGFSRAQYEAKLNENIRIKERIGEVNLLAINEYEKLKERYDYIKAQEQDLLYAIDSLNTAIKRINRVSKAKFISTLKAVDRKMKEVFPILFNGGKACLRLIDETLPLESGVLVEVQPPGKALVHMGLLSGGEKALAAMALLFAIYLVKPSPFMIMDEVDAPFDEVNTDRFNELLRGIEESSQVIMITHNRKTMEQADRLYGITMDTRSVSKVVSVDLEQYHEPLS
jgi:chromosome segregation protein